MLSTLGRSEDLKSQSESGINRPQASDPKKENRFF